MLISEKKINFRGFGCGVLSICDTFWGQNQLIIGKKSRNKCSRREGGVIFWVQIHSSLSVKNVEEREGLEYLWHLLGSKSQLIIGKKNAKKFMVGGILSISDIFWLKIPQKS